MRSWDFDTSNSQMRKAVEDLQVAWQETTNDWNDSVSQKFCKEQLEPIVPAMKLANEAIGRMQHLTTQIQKECES